MCTTCLNKDIRRQKFKIKKVDEIIRWYMMKVRLVFVMIFKLVLCNFVPFVSVWNIVPGWQKCPGESVLWHGCLTGETWSSHSAGALGALLFALGSNRHEDLFTSFFFLSLSLNSIFLFFFSFLSFFLFLHQMLTAGERYWLYEKCILIMWLLEMCCCISLFC